VHARNDDGDDETVAKTFARLLSDPVESRDTDVATAKQETGDGGGAVVRPWKRLRIQWRNIPLRWCEVKRKGLKIAEELEKRKNDLLLKPAASRHSENR